MKVSYRILLSALIMSCINTYTNPVQGLVDSPDPGVIEDGSVYYATTTTGLWNGKAFPIWKSSDLFSWEQVAYAINQKPVWASNDFWAPEIHMIGSYYQLYYTARDHTGHLCIGCAYSERAYGPYRDIGRPLLRNQTEGVIDATVHKHHNGSLYLIYKTDGNAHQKPTQIYAIEMEEDGRSVKGDHKLLIEDTEPWQHGIVEAPWMVYHNSTFYLFYSSCGYADKCYSVGVAKSDDLFGPYIKHDGPILHTSTSQTENSWEGPGHCSVVKSQQGNYGMVYHAWPQGRIGSKRLMLVDKLEWVNGWPSVHNGCPSEESVPQF